MIAISPEYIIDKDSNKKAVVLQISDWKKVIEELEDIRAFDQAKSNNELVISFEESIKDM